MIVDNVKYKSMIEVELALEALNKEFECLRRKAINLRKCANEMHEHNLQNDRENLNHYY